MNVVTGEAMRAADRAAIERFGVPSLVLMENAGSEAARLLREAVPDLARRRVLALCGTGNNGGDGLVAARLLLGAAASVEALLLGPEEKASSGCAENLRRFREAGGGVAPVPDATAWARARVRLAECDVFVDALFGTGLSGPVRGWHAEAIRDLNATPGFVLAIDIPSGLSADSHRVPEPAVRADLTAALAALKPCHALPPAADLCGEVRRVAIGIPEEAFPEGGTGLVFLDAGWAREAAAALRRRPGGHKGDYGRVLVVAGSAGKSGAAALAGFAALRSGAGLVTVATPRSVWPIVAGSHPELMVEPLPETAEGTVAAAALPALERLLEGKDVLAVGPGCSSNRETLGVLRALLERAAVPAVADADALAAVPDGGRAGRPPLLLTPHPGEMARLLGRTVAEVEDDRLAAAREAAARFGATVALKGRRTIVASPEGNAWVASTGNPGMATAGTGDVLTGTAAALLGQRLDPSAALPLAVHVHGLAGDLAATDRGGIGITAGDLLERLPEAFRAARGGP